MNTFTGIMSFLAVSQLIFLSCCVLLNLRRQVLGQLLVVFCLCLISHILTTMPFFVSNTISSFILNRFAVATPAVLWLLAVLLFVDSRRVPPVAVYIMVFYMIARAAGGIFVYRGIEFATGWLSIVFILTQMVMFGFAVHAIYLGIVGREGDLVEVRRRVRIPFVISMGVLIALILSSGFLTYFAGSVSAVGALPLYASLYAILSTYTFFMCLILNLAIFTLHPGTVALLSESTRFATDNSKFVPITKKPDLKLIEKIRKAMEEDKRYQQAGLTIVSLAQFLMVSDYRLRSVISKQMHFRNFSQFLNSYRIKEANQLLQETDHPISTIALNVGYTSLSSFNKVFKESYGVPPREFRTQARNKQAEAAITLPETPIDSGIR